MESLYAVGSKCEYLHKSMQKVILAVRGKSVSGGSDRRQNMEAVKVARIRCFFQLLWKFGSWDKKEREKRRKRCAQ